MHRRRRRATLTGMTARPLPRTLRLAPYRSLMPRGPSSRLVGLDPRTALVVDDLPPPLARMLDELAAPADGAELVARAVRGGAPAAAAQGLLERLVEAGALVDAARVAVGARRRAEAVVAVVGDGPLTVGTATGLALAGVGTVLVDVPGGGGIVGSDDLATGLLDADRGRSRAVAAVDAVRRVAPGVRVGPPPARRVPDLCVLADASAPDPERIAALHRDGVSHLPVRLRDGTGVVGPLVLPGRSACLGCVELHRRARDPDWPLVAAQLVGRPGRAEPATATATAALGVAQVLAALDGAGAAGPGPAAVGVALELDLAAGGLRRRPWSPHPDCTCGAPPERECGPVVGRGTIMG
jgi:bacteriocin biosynthesis cyclodehydratase domain-containing protein